MKYYLKELLYYSIFFILIIFILSILNLIGLPTSITNIIEFTFNLIAFFIFGIRSGKNASNKGYLAGLKIASVLILILIIVNIITTNSLFRLTTIIYYLILIISSVTGGMLGINKKSNN